MQCSHPETSLCVEEELSVESADVILALLCKCAKQLGYLRLKPELEQSIIKFAKGRDVFVSLPTVYEKALHYTMLPCVFDQLPRLKRNV